MFWYLVLSHRSSHTHCMFQSLDMFVIVDVFQYVRTRCRACRLQQLTIAVSVLALSGRPFLFCKRQYKSLLNTLKRQNSQATPSVFMAFVET